MDESNMVRTQVYLPRTIYDKLQQRANQHDLTMATQIRAALEDYLDHADEATTGVFSPDDPIFKMIGQQESQVTDVAINHDHYLYGALKREPETASRRRVLTVHEGAEAPYTALPDSASKPRAARKRAKATKP